MTSDEAKDILRPHHPGAPVTGSELAAALALAETDAELAHWWAAHGQRQAEVRRQFRSIRAPEGLQEQIISEHRALERSRFWRPPVHWLALAALVAVLAGIPFWLHPTPRNGPDLAVYQKQMAGLALRGYGMDVLTNDPREIRSYLAQNHAPADYVLPAALQRAALAGCAVETWQGVKTSMLCFRTGRPLAAGAQSDLWLFVVEAAAVPGTPAGSAPQFTQISRLTTAVWSQNGKLYMLGAVTDEAGLRKFL